MKLSTRKIQRLLYAEGEYEGKIDGIFGPMTRRAVSELLSRRFGLADFWYGYAPERQLVMAAQSLLSEMGYAPGPIDGLVGHNTLEAYRAFWHHAKHGERFSIPGRNEDTGDTTEPLRPQYKDIRTIYGEPGDHNLVSLPLPYQMRLAWDKDTKVGRIRCHKFVVDRFGRLFEGLREHYGMDAIPELGLDLYGGCYNYRKMRGGLRLSTHAWGVAVDLDPEHNRLRWGKDKARFAKPEYDRLWELVQDVGLVGLGPARGFDFMHIQGVAA